MHNQNSSNDTVGLVPFTRRPLHEEDIQATKGDESVTDKCQLDLTKIRLHYNRGELEAGGEELAKQLSGSKWGTGKMARFCSTDDSFIMVAGLADRNAKKNAQEKKVKSDTAAAKKAAAPAKKAAVAAEAARKRKVKEEKKKERDEEKKEEKEEKKRKKEEKVAGQQARKRQKMEKATTLSQQLSAFSSMSPEERANILAVAAAASGEGTGGGRGGEGGKGNGKGKGKGKGKGGRGVGPPQGSSGKPIKGKVCSKV